MPDYRKYLTDVTAYVEGGGRAVRFGRCVEAISEEEALKIVKGEIREKYGEAHSYDRVSVRDVTEEL